jgi:hypothetical protein
MDDEPTIALEGAPKPIFFDLGDVPTPRPDLGERSGRSSSHDDLKRLAAQSTAKPPRPSDDDLLELKSGLFTVARQVPESIMPGPLVSEQKPRDPTARRDLATWAVAVAAVTAATIVVGERFSASLSPSAPDAAQAVPSATSAPTVVTASAPSAAPLPMPAAETAAPRVATVFAPIHHALPSATSEPSSKPPAPLAAVAPSATAQALVERMVAAVPSANDSESESTPPSAPEFDRDAARAALSLAAATALGCRYPGELGGTGRVAITFAPAGRVQSALILGAPFQATHTGSCIAAAFRSASVPAFAGPPVLVTREVSVR